MLYKIQKKRIAIIGMGYAGLALCFHLLALRAGEVTLFDRHPHGEGASLVSAGLLHLYPGGEARLAQDGIAGLHATQELLKISSSALGRLVFTQKGLIRLAMSPKQRAAFLERATQYSDITFLEEHQMAERLPFLPARAGLWLPHAMVVDAEEYLEGLRQICFQEGAQYVQQEIQPGAAWHGLNIAGEFDAVVMAMGAGVATLPAFASLPLRQIKGQVLQLSWPKDLPFFDFPITGDCYMLPNHQEGRCLVGATFEKDFTSLLACREQAENLLRPRVEAIAPQFIQSDCLDVRAGVRLTTPQHKPIAKQIKPRLWALTALGSKGLLHHALLARTLAEEIVKA